jgi:hypothetical protein
MEKPLQLNQVKTGGDSRLRFVFDDAVISLRLASDATFEDIARTLEKVGAKHRHKPVAIDVRLAASSVRR